MSRRDNELKSVLQSRTFLLWQWGGVRETIDHHALYIIQELREMWEN